MTRTSRRVLPAVLVVAAYLACLVAAHGQPRTHLESRGQPNGWINAQPSEDAQTYFFPVRPSSGSSTTVVSNSTDTASIYAYIDQGALDTAASRAKLKRVVIQIHGKGRDCWNYFDHTRVARTEAIKQSNGLVKKGEVLLVAPNFWINTDRRAFPYEAGKGGTSDLMVWKGNDWSDGGDSIYPRHTNGISSFEVLDSLIKRFSDPSEFPNVNTIVVSGHSMGGQMVHRYAMLGLAQPTNPKVQISFAIMNPGSLLWVDEARPRSVKECPDYNDYKYGLDNMDLTYAIDADGTSSSPSSLFSRYVQRNIHHLQGLEDHAKGDRRCAAQVQGSYHLRRGEYWAGWLQTQGEWPERTTIDYVPGIGHDDQGMFTSPDGLQRLFYDHYDGKSKARKSNAPNGYSNGVEYRPHTP